MICSALRRARPTRTPKELRFFRVDVVVKAQSIARVSLLIFESDEVLMTVPDDTGITYWNQVESSGAQYFATEGLWSILTNRYDAHSRRVPK
jgi:hypothetical protein